MSVSEARSHEPEGLGARLRELRRGQRRTLADVAAASGLTKGYVSKLENGQANASMASLVRLCDALGTPLGALFEPTGGRVVRKGAYPGISFGGVGMQEYLLTPRSERRLQAILSEIEPDGGSGEALYALPTDVEFVFVLAGTLEVDVAGDPLTLSAGDAYTFPGSTEHAFRVTGEGPARILWVVTPALPDGTERTAAEQHDEIEEIR